MTLDNDGSGGTTLLIQEGVDAAQTVLAETAPSRWRDRSAEEEWVIGGNMAMPTDPGWSRDDHFAVKSWQGTAVGACIALVVPMAFFLLALLLKIGVVPSDQMHAPLLTLIMFSEVLLGPSGIVIAGWSAGVRGFVPWLFLIIVAAPLVGAVWVVSLLLFGGATGSPA